MPKGEGVAASTPVSLFLRQDVEAPRGQSERIPSQEIGHFEHLLVQGAFGFMQIPSDDFL